MTNGLKRACKKKNDLYSVFINQKTPEAENKYKTYENKLINIIRICKKENYYKTLNTNNNNFKEVWKL